VKITVYYVCSWGGVQWFTNNSGTEYRPTVVPGSHSSLDGATAIAVNVELRQEQAARRGESMIAEVQSRLTVRRPCTFLDSGHGPPVPDPIL
jgi:hypothetical protein